MAGTSDGDREWLAYGDPMRIYACIAVVTLHGLAWALYYQGNTFPGIWSLNNVLRSACRWSVPLFIMLSGAIFLSGHGPESLSSFYAKRIRRVGIPLVFWSAVYFVYTHTVKPIPFSLSRDLYALLKGQPYYHLYFLFVMIGLYLITPALKTWLQRTDPKDFQTYLILILAGTSASVLVNKLTASQALNAFSLFVPFLGYYLAGYRLRSTALSKTGILLVAAAFCASILATAYEPWLLPRIPGIREPDKFDLIFNYLSPAVIVMSLSAYLLISNLPRLAPKPAAPPNPALRLIARSTFGVYLIHPLILEPLYFLYFRLFPEALPRDQETLLLLLATLILSLLVILPLTKIPLVRHLVS